MLISDQFGIIQTLQMTPFPKPSFLVGTVFLPFLAANWLQLVVWQLAQSCWHQTVAVQFLDNDYLHSHCILYHMCSHTCAGVSMYKDAKSVAIAHSHFHTLLPARNRMKMCAHQIQQCTHYTVLSVGTDSIYAGSTCLLSKHIPKVNDTPSRFKMPRI